MTGKVLSVKDFPPLVDPSEPAVAVYLRRETYRRNQICATTFGIELRDVSVMLEGDWDRIAQSIDTSLGVCDPVLDEFFRTRFSPLTTSWIHEHPRLEEVAQWFDRYQRIMRGCFDFSHPSYRDKVKRKT